MIVRLDAESEHLRRGYRMKVHLRTNSLLIAAAALLAALASPSHAESTPPPGCAASQAAAIQCFVANAVSTGLTHILRHQVLRNTRLGFDHVVRVSLLISARPTIAACSVGSTKLQIQLLIVAGSRVFRRIIGRTERNLPR
jgi:hypothetical protein